MDKKKIIIITCVITIFAFIGIGIIVYSYGYVTSNIINTDGKGKYYVVDNLRIEYSDGSETLESKENGVFIPGSTIVKTFSVKNTGNHNIIYDVLFTDIENSFNRKSDIVYELYVGSELVSENVFPNEKLEYIVGDINSDGIIDQLDFNKLDAFIKNTGTLSKLGMIAADLNLDNVLNEYDSSSLIKEYLNNVGNSNFETNIGKVNITDNIDTILSKQVLKVDESINYTLKIKYLTSSENQIEDSGKVINAKISFEQSS